MSAVLLCLAAAMLAYDTIGHAACAFAIWHAERRNSARAAYLWNTYSIYVWPRIHHKFTYDLYWTAWHGTTLGFFIAAYATK